MFHVNPTQYDEVMLEQARNAIKIMIKGEKLKIQARKLWILSKHCNIASNMHTNYEVILI